MELLGRAPGVPLVGVLRCYPQRSTFTGTTHEQRERRLDRLGLACCVVELVEDTVQRGPRLAQQRPDRAACLLELVKPAARRRQVDPVCGMFVDLPASAHAEHEPTTGRGPWSP